MANSADPDQLASSEANWSGSTLFAKAGQGLNVLSGIYLSVTFIDADQQYISEETQEMSQAWNTAFPGYKTPSKHFT